MGLFSAGVTAILTATIAQPGDIPAEHAKHVIVYHEEGRYGGWPANHGMWSWDNEILVGFSRGWYKDLGPDRHHIDREKPEEHWLARSLDGGETWTLEDPAKQGDLLIDGGFLHGIPREGVEIPQLMDPPGAINFTHPDFAMTMRTSDINAGQSRFWYSYTRGKTWEGPYRIPNFGHPGTAARTDYIVEGEDTATMFITVAKENGEEGRPICIRTNDGGKTFNKISEIGPEPDGFSIMPASVKLGENEYYVAVRRRDGDRRWIGAYRSMDGGQTWSAQPDPVAHAGEGNPPSVIQLDDGRLCLTWGYRAEPFSILAKLSDTGGRIWGPTITLRDDGANRDVGYCRSIQRPDGNVVTTYYFNDKHTGPERYIAATIWNPNLH